MLGGFHTEVVILCTIGTCSLMSGACPNEAISQVLSDASVDQMLNGKAVSRAVRAHLLVDRALHTNSTAHMCKLPIPCVLSEPSSDDLIRRC